MIPRLLAAACALLLSVPVAAQGRDDAATAPTPQRPAQPAKPSTPPKPPKPPTPAAPAAPVPPAAPDQVPAPPAEPSQPINVRIDVTIVEQQGPATPTRKTVSLVVADGETGSARSEAVVGVKEAGFQNLPLNVDARPRLIDPNRVRVRLIVNWKVLAPAGIAAGSSTQVTEQVAPILESGKPLVVAQSADPVTDRQVTVEVKATILR